MNLTYVEDPISHVKAIAQTAIFQIIPHERMTYITNEKKIMFHIKLVSYVVPFQYKLRIPSF